VAIIRMEQAITQLEDGIARLQDVSERSVNAHSTHEAFRYVRQRLERIDLSQLSRSLDAWREWLEVGRNNGSYHHLRSDRGGTSRWTSHAVRRAGLGEAPLILDDVIWQHTLRRTGRPYSNGSRSGSERKSPSSSQRPPPSARPFTSTASPILRPYGHTERAGEGRATTDAPPLLDTLFLPLSSTSAHDYGPSRPEVVGRGGAGSRRRPSSAPRQRHGPGTDPDYSPSRPPDYSPSRRDVRGRWHSGPSTSRVRRSKPRVIHVEDEDYGVLDSVDSWDEEFEYGYTSAPNHRFGR